MTNEQTFDRQDDLLLKTLLQFPSPEWITQYFNLLKKLLIELDISNDDPRLAMSLNRNKTLPVNLGQRYVLKPVAGGYLRCIVPAAFAEESVGGEVLFNFKKKGKVDAKWIQIYYPVGAELSPALYYACADACTTILDNCKRSGYHKFHNRDLYRFTMEPAVRNEILREIKMEVV